MKTPGLIVALLFLFATSLSAQEKSHPPKPGPYLPSFQSVTAPKLSVKAAAVAADRDLTSEKIAIAVVVVIIAVVVIRTLK